LWVASGEDFEPNDTVPMQRAVLSGASHARRITTASRRDGSEPAVIAICGMGPITYHVVDASKPDLRVL
jgi:hypothetical protein